MRQNVQASLAPLTSEEIRFLETGERLARLPAKHLHVKTVGQNAPVWAVQSDHTEKSINKTTGLAGGFIFLIFCIVRASVT